MNTEEAFTPEQVTEVVGALHLLDSLRRADGSRLVEGDQHIDLRVGAQHGQRVRAGTGGVGVC